MMRAHARARLVVAGTILAALLPGCALVDRQVRLTYPPHENGATAIAADTNGPVVALTVIDARTGNRNAIGTVRNGFYMHTADVTTTDDAVPWVRAAMEQELRAAGLQVVPPGQGGAAALDARLVKLDCDAYFTYSGEVVLETSVSGPAVAARAETVTGAGGAGMNWTATQEAFGESLALALQDAARKVAANVRSALATPALARP